MPSKTLIAGLLAAVACLWLLLTWEPVAREQHESSTAGAGQAAPEPETHTEAAPVAGTTAPPTAAVEPAPASPQLAAAEPAPDEAPEPELRTESGELRSSMKLERIPDEALDPANMQPPARSGPLAELTKDFESAARDASSAQLELQAEAAFRTPQVPAELLESVVCHGSVCRVRTRWNQKRSGGFMLAMMSLTARPPSEESQAPFESNFAIGDAAERNSNGERPLEVYVRRRTEPK